MCDVMCGNARLSDNADGEEDAAGLRDVLS